MSTTRTPSDSDTAPSYALLATEPVRAVLEFASHCFFDHAGLPVGDGHPVVIFPGLGTNERLTQPLQSLCRRLGYDAKHWGQGFNVGPQGDIDAWLDALAVHVGQLTSHHHTPPATLMGWSLGGIYAREVAKRLHGQVRQVITIGTPVAGTSGNTNAALVYRLLNGNRPPDDRRLLDALRKPPAVPTTSIYSRGDGVVAWQACLETCRGKRIENIEVGGSHFGMCWNPAVLRVVADRLAQPVGRWRPYGGGEGAWAGTAAAAAP